MSYDVFDHVTLRCPMLGGQVTFAYCRTLEDGLPCHRALVCHQRHFPVERFFRQILEAETFERCFAGPDRDRYERFLATVGEARRRAEGEE